MDAGRFGCDTGARVLKLVGGSLGGMVESGGRFLADDAVQVGPVELSLARAAGRMMRC